MRGFGAADGPAPLPYCGHLGSLAKCPIWPHLKHRTGALDGPVLRTGLAAEGPLD